MRRSQGRREGGWKSSERRRAKRRRRYDECKNEMYIGSSRKEEYLDQSNGRFTYCKPPLLIGCRLEVCLPDACMKAARKIKNCCEMVWGFGYEQKQARAALATTKRTAFALCKFKHAPSHCALLSQSSRAMRKTHISCSFASEASKCEMPGSHPPPFGM